MNGESQLEESGIETDGTGGRIEMDKVKILVVDDESRMRKLVRDFLTRQNYEVLEAADGEEALDIFYKDKAIALLILDVMMPKMNGWEVCREIRQTSKSSDHHAHGQK